MIVTSVLIGISNNSYKYNGIVMILISNDYYKCYDSYNYKDSYK